MDNAMNFPLLLFILFRQFTSQFIDEIILVWQNRRREVITVFQWKASNVQTLSRYRRGYNHVAGDSILRIFFQQHEPGVRLQFTKYLPHIFSNKIATSCPQVVFREIIYKNVIPIKIDYIN